MKLWLTIEERSIELAAERRMREASSFVNDYADGLLNQEEANRRLRAHEEKWGLGAKDEVLGWQLRDEASASIYTSRIKKQARGDGTPGL
jgi:hypothetical protein